MKVNVFPIVADHLNTLRNANTGRYSALDFILFYVVPIGCSIAAATFCLRLTETFYNLSITFFGIFIALLLNVQVAIFGIFQRKWDVPSDDKLAAIQREKLEERRTLLGELNSNLSYLVLVSCISLIIFLLFFVFDVKLWAKSAATVAIYTHFVLTLMMSVKRAHTLFQMEYEGNC